VIAVLSIVGLASGAVSAAACYGLGLAVGHVIGWGISAVWS